MNASQSGEILQSMINFIKSHGDERVAEIEDEADEGFSVGKEKQIENEKKRLTAKLEQDIANASVKMKIERSAVMNKSRIEKMRYTNELVQSLVLDSKVRMHRNLEAEPAKYETLLKELLIQGLIKLIEPEIMLKVRKSDLGKVKKAIPGAIEVYKQMMLKEVKALTGKSDIPCRVEIDERNFLPEWNEQDPENSCLGGFVIYARENRIVCSQTLDDRMELVFAQAVPVIRHDLFPSLRKRQA